MNFKWGGKEEKKAFPLPSTCPSGSKGFVKDTKEPDYSGWKKGRNDADFPFLFSSIQLLACANIILALGINFGFFFFLFFFYFFRFFWSSSFPTHGLLRMHNSCEPSGRLLDGAQNYMSAPPKIIKKFKKSFSSMRGSSVKPIVTISLCWKKNLWRLIGKCHSRLEASIILKIDYWQLNSNVTMYF